MGDFFTGLSYGDQLEMGTAVVGGGMDHETLNAMIRQEQDARALATQVQKYGPGHGRDAVSQAVAPGTTPADGGQVASNTGNARAGARQTAQEGRYQGADISSASGDEARLGRRRRP